MTGKEILNALNDLEDDLIEDAREDTIMKKKKKRLVKWPAAAAIILFVMAGGTIMKTYGLTAKLEKFFSEEEETGYELKRYPVREFTGEVQEVESIIKQQIKEYKPISSQAPQSWSRRFDSSDEAMNYLGFAPLKKPSWEFQEQSVELRILGNEQGKFITVTMEIDYNVENLWLQSISKVYTEYSKEEELKIKDETYESLESMLHAKEDEIFVEVEGELIPAESKSIYVTENLKQGLVVKFPVYQGKNASMSAYLVEEGVIYHLNVAYPKEKEEKAEELLYQWLEQF